MLGRHSAHTRKEAVLSARLLQVITVVALAASAAGCVSVVGTNERGLLYRASGAPEKTSVGPGWYFRAPWNKYVNYDVRWKRYQEEVDVRTKDGLHVKATIAVVVRPKLGDLYTLHQTIGPDFYEQLVKPALYASTRDTGGEFNHLEASTHTRDVETRIKRQLLERLRGQSVEIGEVAMPHFDLPAEVQAAANRTAAATQLIAAKQVDMDLAQKQADLERAQRRGRLEAEGMERQLKAEQELAAAEQQLKIEEARRKSERQRQEAAAEAVVMRAEAEAKATLLAADAEKQRIAATSAKLTPNYIRLQAIQALATAMSGPNTKVIVMPTGKNGLPSFFAPFLNPMSAVDGLTASK